MEPQPNKTLHDVILQGDAGNIEKYLRQLDSHDAARAFCELSDNDQATMLSTLEPATAAEVLDDMPDVEVVEVVGNLEPAIAAAILQEMPSDDQADVVGSLDDDEAEAVLGAMDSAEAELLRQLAAYPQDSAGGLMAIELFAVRSKAQVGRVIEELRADADRLRNLDVQYAYVTNRESKLVGVLRLRDLLLAESSTLVSDIMIRDPLSVNADAMLMELDQLFRGNAFLGVPVTDEEGRLVGVVSREAVDAAWQEHAERDFRRSMGMVQEEFRSMPTLRRSRLRLSWLTINIVLNIIAASVIAAYQETLSQVIALAVFLPIISDMSGCSGNQAVAVSIRELSLGLIRPYELFRVWAKEAMVGVLNGIALGALLGGVAWFFSDSVWLGIVVGVALALNTLLAVMLGGALPLLLKRMGVDPALASGPVLTTLTDMMGFFLVLSIATAMLAKLVV